jgi:CxxC motif-containing protein (DUF1111 family)
MSHVVSVRLVRVLSLWALPYWFAAPAFGWQSNSKNAPRDVTPPLEKRVEQEKSGRELFVRDWSQPDAKPTAGGDGLGPMFNDVSCVACHQIGGIGGAGPKSKNARLLHLTGPHGSPLQSTQSISERLEQARRNVHPDLANGTTTVVLHRQQRGNADDASEYQRWLERRLPRSTGRQTLAATVEGGAQGVGRRLPRSAGSQTPKQSLLKPAIIPTTFHPLEPMPGTYRAERLPVRLTERNTTALFGAGLIDLIPDSAIVEMSERQKKEHAPFISGRVPQTATGGIGRFGWRGQIGSLQEFAMTACAVELGLQVPGHAQTPLVLPSKDDVASVETRRFATGSGAKDDLTQEQCDALTAYVAGLPAPQSARTGSLDRAKSVQRGDRLFDELNCSVCHARNLGSVNGLFSDLLLHDMGPGLSDPAPAMPEIHEQISPGGVSGYFGISVQLVKNVTTNIHQEWRTPPLWGVADSAPYLHDGRAQSLEQAIQMHGGEGQRAAEAFRALKPDQRNDLQNFLQSLTATPDNPQRRGAFGGTGSVAGGGFF